MQMATRIKDMRQLLYEKLKVHEIDWPHVINQIGMFSYTGLTRKFQLLLSLAATSTQILYELVIFEDL